jgi:hypothetical protein
MHSSKTQDCLRDNEKYDSHFEIVLLLRKSKHHMEYDFMLSMMWNFVKLWKHAKDN